MTAAPKWGRSTSSAAGEAAPTVIGTTITHVKASGGDDTAAIQTALSTGDVLLTGDGLDYHVGYIAQTYTASRRVIALSPVRIVQTDVRGVFSFRGGWDELGTVSSIATVTNADLVYPGESNPTSSRTTVSQLTMAAATTVKRGDIVKVVSDDAHPWARPSQGNLMGEFSSVGADVSAGTTINLSNVLIEAYATNIRLVRLRDVRFEVRGEITFDTDPAIRETAYYGAVIELRACRDSYIGGGVRIFNSVGRAIGNYGYSTHVDGVDFRLLANRPSKSHYGYGVQDGGWLLRMTGCHGERLRHLYSEGANTVATGSTSYEYYGGGSFAHVSDCVAMNCEGQAFDTHGSSYGVRFESCAVYGSFQGASSGGPGISTRGRYTTIDSCLVDGCFRGIVLGGYRARVYNSHVRRSRYSALEFTADTADSSQQTTQGGYEVIGGSYETIGANRCFSLIPTAGYVVTGKLKGVTFRPVSMASGHNVMEAGFSAAAGNVAGNKLVFDDIDVDMALSGAVVLASVLVLQTDNLTVRGRLLKVDASASAVASANIINSAGAGSGNGADCQVEDIRWDSPSVSPTVFNAGLTATLGSYFYRNNTGTSWFHWNPSYDQTIASAAGATLPIARLLDRDITVRITGGSAAAVAFANIPATPRQNGARLTVVNISTDTVTINGVAIAPNAVARWVYTGGTWRPA